MSADFFSLVAWMKPVTARRVFADLCTRKLVREDVVDSTGSSVFDPFCGEPFERRTLATLLCGKGPGPEDFSTAFVDAGSGDAERDAAFLAQFGNSSRCVMSPNYPAIVVIDRVLAIPYGLSLMRGQAVARVRSKGVSRLAVGWPRMLEQAGGQKRAARRIANYLDRWGNGYTDSVQVLSAISDGIELAKKQDRDLLFVGLAVP